MRRSGKGWCSINYFSHSGDYGDIIYSLPAILASGGGELVLFPAPGKTRVTMTEGWAAGILPLLQAQTYLFNVRWCENAKDSSLNGFRHHWGNGQNNADYHLRTQGMTWQARCVKWLWVEPKRVSAVIFSRSLRNHGHAFDYRSALETYPDRAFVGTPEEHEDFTSRYGKIDRLDTKTLLDVAEVIEGADLFIGNGSAPCAISEGLKQNMVFEVCSWNNSGIFERMGRINLWDECVEWPNLKKLPPR